MSPHHTNALVNESSPYLLQHAHNPVNWYPWGKEALKRAASENKLIIVSIGYSSCHWCHVMEHESFEDEEVAGLMNDRFISIKVDREERPDIDHIYMTAVQMMNQQGGWPLNCIALPDGRPIWGGTYFPKEQWMHALDQVERFHREQPEKTLEYAENLESGIRQVSLHMTGEPENAPDQDELRKSVKQWSEQFDRQWGGMKRAPKFPMPVNLEFLLHFGMVEDDREILEHVENTLMHMARGGIYDQAGGGFSRYSVDAHWKVPHFEKMLYDNAQLVSLYSKAYRHFGRKEFLDLVEQTIEYLEREMLGEHGLFFSALDADSEGEEGKFYIWKKDELKEILGEEYPLFSEYYQVNERGHWEDGKYILLRTEDPESFADSHSLHKGSFRKRVREWNRTIMEARSKRVRPGLDDKSLTSWNALMVSGLCEAYRASGKEKYRARAIHTAEALRSYQFSAEGILHRNFKAGRSSIPGFHDDYALFMAACLDLGEICPGKDWFQFAANLETIIREAFYDEDAEWYRYNSIHSEVLISHHHETQDNVIPSSNSVMAHNLFRLGHAMGEPSHLARAKSMVARLWERILQYPGGFSGWSRLLLLQLHPFYEVVVTGPGSDATLREIQREYHPTILTAASSEKSNFALFRDRYSSSKTRIFVCRDNVCQLPVENVKDAKAKFHSR